MAATLLWLRQDLRLQDQPALQAALARGVAIIPVYITPEETRVGGRTGGALGAAGGWWLHHSLAALDSSLRERGSRLVLAQGDPAVVLSRLVRATGATAVYWNHNYLPVETARDSRLRAELAAAGIEARSFHSHLLHDPASVANRQDRPFQVFSAFWRLCLTLPVTAPLKLPPGPLPAPARWPASLALAELGLLEAAGSTDLAAHWQPGEQASTRRLSTFVRTQLDAYATLRDRPAIDGTSRLSAALHFGEISPRQVWAAVRSLARATGVFPPSNGARVFLAELGWREFAGHLLYHFPHTARAPLRREFAQFPWLDHPAHLQAWRTGQTGYPIVDAGMRQLAATGWMHNRVRMVVASFLTKHLRLPWTEGAAWFADRLVDADLANNTLGWQWAAGCGADAAPYFRIFAPVLQGRKFDPAGDYVRRWVPELAGLPARFIHAPWDAPAETLAQADVRLGDNYPRPIVDHATARREALAAFQAWRVQARPRPD